MSQEDSWSGRRGAGSAFQPGSVLGDYELVRIIDQGGMAAVFEARHRTRSERVALKVLGEVHGGRSVELVRRFMREADNAARINHPNVVRVSQVATAQGTPFLVMELLEGEELTALLKRVGRLSVEVAADIMIPVCCALAAGHDAGVVHRDLKPQNIFLCRTRNGSVVPKVVHFGAAKLNESIVLARTMSDAIVGTPYYMSPEQTMEADHVDPRSDQFSFAAILYECVAGRRPFDSRSLFTVLTSIVHLQQESMGSESEPVDLALEALVERGLAKKADQRFADMRELGRALLPFASQRVQAAYVAELGNVKAGRSSTSAVPVEARESNPIKTRDSAGSAYDSGSLRSSKSARPLAANGSTSGQPLPGSSVDETRVEKSDPARSTTRRADQPPSKTSLALIAGVLVVGGAVGVWQLIPRAAVPVPPPPPLPVVAASAVDAEVAQQQGATPGDWDEGEGGAPLEEPEDPNRFVVEVDVEPVTGTFLLDGVYAGTGKARLSLPRDGKRHTLQVLARGYEPTELEFRDEAIKRHVVLEAQTEETAPTRRHRARRTSR